MGCEQNWLLHLTVNQAPYGIRGSSPWQPTKHTSDNPSCCNGTALRSLKGWAGTQPATSSMRV
jgi:hypothetical protein